MGLSNNLNDVSSDSIPILLVLTAASWVSYLRSLLLCLLHSLGLLHRLPPTAADSSLSSLGSGLAGLIALADHLNFNPAYSYPGVEESEAAPVAETDVPPPSNPAVDPDCVVCLCGLREGERVRRLSCRHVFHSECLDGWFDQMNLSCPLCRLPLVTEERRADAEQRIGAELVAWLSPYY